MNTFIGGAWRGFTSFVREAGVWVERIPFVRVAGVGWRGRGAIEQSVDVGSASCTFWIEAAFEWTPPADETMITISCVATVFQHVEISENQAVIATGIFGWDGSRWVLLANRGNQGCSFKGETLTQTVSFTFNPFNTIYSRFRFSTGGNSFNRTIVGRKNRWLGNVTIPG